MQSALSIYTSPAQKLTQQWIDPSKDRPLNGPTHQNIDPSKDWPNKGMIHQRTDPSKVAHQRIALLRNDNIRMELAS